MDCGFRRSDDVAISYAIALYKTGPSVAVFHRDAYYTLPLRLAKQTIQSTRITEIDMAVGSTYKVVELVGSSSESVQQAIDGAIARAAQTIRNLDWFEVREIRGTIDDGKANWYQVKVGVGFRVDSGEDITDD